MHVGLLGAGGPKGCPALALTLGTRPGASCQHALHIRLGFACQAAWQSFRIRR